LEIIIMQNTISAVFDSHEEAERAVNELRSLGVRDNDLSVIVQDGRTTTTSSGDGEVTDEHHGNLLRGILGGGALGAGLGVAALAIPGVGPLVAAGAIAASAVPGAAAIGAAAGAVGGSLNEVFTSHGVSEEDAGYYSEHVATGGVFVSVDTGDSGADPSTVRDVLARSGGHNAASPRSAEIGAI
jgi:uncharacterized membrane protein